jgi:hypothetical protein
VDGVSVDFKTPIKIALTNAGTHTITVSLDGYHPKTSNVFLRFNSEERLDFGNLDKIIIPPQYSPVTVITDPEGAKVFVDGDTSQDQRTTANGLTLAVKEGNHTVRVELSGYRPDTKYFLAPRSTPLEFKLIPLDGRLNVTSIPEYASVYLDSAAKGSTPLRDLAVRPKESHRLEVMKSDYITFTTTFTLAPGQTTNIEVQLEKKPVEKPVLVVKSDPSDAEIAVDGKSINAKTPRQLTFAEPGEYKIGVSLADYVSVSRTVRLAAGDTQTMDFGKLQPVTKDPPPIKEPQPPVSRNYETEFQKQREAQAKQLDEKARSLDGQARDSRSRTDKAQYEAEAAQARADAAKARAEAANDRTETAKKLTSESTGQPGVKYYDPIVLKQTQDQADKNYQKALYEANRKAEDFKNVVNASQQNNLLTELKGFYTYFRREAGSVRTEAHVAEINRFLLTWAKISFSLLVILIASSTRRSYPRLVGFLDQTHGKLTTKTTS